jgi:hypothetical protein
MTNKTYHFKGGFYNCNKTQMQKFKVSDTVKGRKKKKKD